MQNESRDDGRGDRAAERQAAVADRLVEEIAVRGAKRSADRATETFILHLLLDLDGYDQLGIED
jgi:hypothetical protein